MPSRMAVVLRDDMVKCLSLCVCEGFVYGFVAVQMKAGAMDGGVVEFAQMRGVSPVEIACGMMY